MIPPFNAAQDAIFDVLNGAVVDGATVAEIYDQVPQGTKAFPYVEIGAYEVSHEGTKNGVGRYYYRPVINIYSIAEGTREANALAEKVVELLTGTELDLSESGFCVLNVFFSGSSMRKLFDGELLVRHAAIRFEIQILEEVS